MRTIVVITSNLLTFEIQGDIWEGLPTNTVTGAVGAVVFISPKTQVAAFPDVHAIYYKDKGELVTDDDEDD